MMKNKKKKKIVRKSSQRGRFGVFMVFWMFLAAVFSWAIISQLERREKYEAETAGILREIDDMNEKERELAERLEFVESDAYIEKIAREHLGLAAPDETIFIVD